MATDSTPAPPLTCDDLLQLKPCLGSYLENFLPLFPRRDQGTSFLAYCKGLVSGERRKSVERMVLRAQGRHEPGAPPAVLCGGQSLVRPAVPGTALAGGGGGVGHARGRPAGGHDRHAQAGDAFGRSGPAVLRTAGKLENCQAGVFVTHAEEGEATQFQPRRRVRACVPRVLVHPQPDLGPAPGEGSLFVRTNHAGQLAALGRGQCYPILYDRYRAGFP